MHPNGIVYIQDETAYAFVANFDDFMQKLPNYIMSTE